MSNIVFQTEWFRVIQNRVTQFHKPYYTIETGDGVVILAITKNKEIVLVRQYRPASDSHTLEIPSGAIDGSESTIKAAKRELHEETGYTSTHFKLLGSDFSVMENRITGRNNFFIALEAKRGPNHIPEKNIETILVNQTEFENLIKMGKFHHTAGVAVLALAKLHNYL